MPADAERPEPVLIVVTGRPGTGKTTVSRGLVTELGASYLRVDAIETALMTASGADSVGVEGYAVAHLLAASNLALQNDVVVDAVCPVPESRAEWTGTASAAGARLIIFETALPDRDEHRRRVERRAPDLPGQRVPTWAAVLAGPWVPWDRQRDGDRTVLDCSDPGAAVRAALQAIGEHRGGDGGVARPPAQS